MAHLRQSRPDSGLGFQEDSEGQILALASRKKQRRPRPGLSLSICARLSGEPGLISPPKETGLLLLSSSLLSSLELSDTQVYEP